MSTIDAKNEILGMLETTLRHTMPVYAERLHSEDATIEDLRKFVDMGMKALGIGLADKADSRVVVDIYIENGLVQSGSPPVLELDTSALEKEAARAVVKLDAVDITPTVQPKHEDTAKTAEEVFSSLLDDLVPLDD